MKLQDVVLEIVQPKVHRNQMFTAADIDAELGITRCSLVEEVGSALQDLYEEGKLPGYDYSYVVVGDDEDEVCVFHKAGAQAGDYALAKGTNADEVEVAEEEEELFEEATPGVVSDFVPLPISNKPIAARTSSAW